MSRVRDVCGYRVPSEVLPGALARPTESNIVWLQQFGRGLRTAEGKSHVNVIDYVGNHRSFLQAPMLLLPGASTHGTLAAALTACEAGTLTLPPGCEVTYELEALDLLRGLIPQGTQALAALEFWYETFVEQEGVRPTAAEAWHAGHDPAAVRSKFGSWPGFVGAKNGLSGAEAAAVDSHNEFLRPLEKTQMTRSYKMVLLLAMIAEGAFPGEIELDHLTEAFATYAHRSPVLEGDVGEDLADHTKLKSMLERNPINAWIGGRGMGGRVWFAHEDETFRSLIDVQDEGQTALAELTREIAEWRLAQYLERRIGERGG